eukprot:TRINITY_DN65658_c0_g1_i1.p1 TRINITY_DN65658_c0_g1~~TRINITY_DN65658_c0_g1_i1.p1  ORF type:complete len:190 (+),score=20.73 TRINITY_DN65658_c0_g1_i1:39-608(+)
MPPIGENCGKDVGGSAAKELTVIFLDLDGVLNRTASATHIRLDEDLIKNLKDLVDRSDAHIVLSTYWRKFDAYIAYVLSRYGIAAERIIGSTPGPGHLDGSSFDEVVYVSRSDEIYAWLQEHPEVTSFVVLDDRAYAGRHPSIAPYFVQTRSDLGLSVLDVEKALEILRRGRHVPALDDTSRQSECSTS